MHRRRDEQTSPHLSPKRERLFAPWFVCVISTSQSARVSVLPCNRFIHLSTFSLKKHFILPGCYLCTVDCQRIQFKCILCWHCGYLAHKANKNTRTKISFDQVTITKKRIIIKIYCGNQLNNPGQRSRLKVLIANVLNIFPSQ